MAFRRRQPLRRYAVSFALGAAAGSVIVTIVVLVFARQLAERVGLELHERGEPTNCLDLHTYFADHVCMRRRDLPPLLCPESSAVRVPVAPPEAAFFELVHVDAYGVNANASHLQLVDHRDRETNTSQTFIVRLPTTTTARASAFSLDPDEIIIAVMSSPHTAYRTLAIEHTWKRRSPVPVVIFWASKEDVRLFLEENEPSLPPLYSPYNWASPLTRPDIVALDVQPSNSHNILGETIAALKYIWATYPDNKWFMKCDDDTFVVVPNLIAALRQYDPDEPYFIGRTLDFRDVNSGGAGYVISRGAMARLIPVLETCHAEVVGDIAEDVIVTMCLGSVGINATLHLGFHFAQPEQMLFLQASSHPEGFLQFPITFHWMSYEKMFAMDYLLYEARVAAV